MSLYLLFLAALANEPQRPMVGHSLMAASQALAAELDRHLVYAEADDPCGMPGRGTVDYADAGSPAASDQNLREALYAASTAEGLEAAWNRAEGRRLEVSDDGGVLTVRLHGKMEDCQQEVAAPNPHSLAPRAGRFVGRDGLREMLQDYHPDLVVGGDGASSTDVWFADGQQSIIQLLVAGMMDEPRHRLSVIWLEDPGGSVFKASRRVTLSGEESVPPAMSAEASALRAIRFELEWTRYLIEEGLPTDPDPEVHLGEVQTFGAAEQILLRKEQQWISAHGGLPYGLDKVVEEVVAEHARRVMK